MKTNSLKKNDEIELTITALSSQGSGIGHYEGMAVFVDSAAVGDMLRVHIIKVKSSYAVGKIIRIIKPSKHRIMPDCPVYERCGGCSYRHITYAEELEVKRQRVEDALRRIGGLDITVSEIIRQENVDGYRNKAQYPIGFDAGGKTVIGFYAKKSHRIIDCRNCALQPPEFEAILNVIAKWAAENGVSFYDEEKHKGLLRHIYIRKGRNTGQTMVCLVINGDSIPKKEKLIKNLTETDETVCSVVLNINREKTNVILGGQCTTIYGEDYIEDELCGLTFRISPLSFYQVNPTGAKLLYEKAAEMAELKKTDTLLDLYCGAGTIGLSMADKVKKVVGVEIIEQAVENAKENARLNGIENAEFFCSDAAEVSAELFEKGFMPDVIVLDPPRKGCSREMIDTAVKLKPERIVYVSCDPATLARDCKIFGELGYQTKKAVAVDMFPRTVHVETVVQLVRKKPDTYIDITVDMDELDLTSSEAKATYDEIKDYIFDKHRVKVSSLYIAQIKQKHGIIERDCYNNSKKDNTKQPQCPPEKVKLIEEALRHFKMI